MDKLSYAIFYADDINIIVTSTNYNDLHKKVNVIPKLISEWFQINQLVLNKNKTFAINFSYLKFQLIQNFTLTELNNFLGTHLNINLSWALHGKIIEVTEYSMQIDEEFVLLYDSRHIKDSLFCTFSVIVAIWNNFLELTYKHT